MSKDDLLAPWVRRFLIEHLPIERNLSRNTQQSYRDALRLALPYMARMARKPVDQLIVPDLSADRIRSFLRHLEENCSCCAATRNQRLAAMHSLARFIGMRRPDYLAWTHELRSVPFKRKDTALVPYLEKPEMDALLAAPNRTTWLGERDHVLLLFLYNTGARADEVATLLVSDLELPKRGTPTTRIFGKGKKERRVPLWTRTADGLAKLIEFCSSTDRVFLNRRREPMTRFGIHAVVERHAQRAAQSMPSMATKRISPHTIRHTTATHLLRAGVDINTIRSWLGHASLDTTNIYAEIDLKMKADALAKCRIAPGRPARRLKDDKDLMTFLRSL
jgi:site-specific recombinase XerD